MPDEFSEAGGKPFDVNARDSARQVTTPSAASAPVSPSGVPGNPQGQPSPEVMSAFGLPSAHVQGAPEAKPAAPNPMFQANGVKPPAQTPPPAPVASTHVDANGQQIVENYSAVIQRHAEEAYATALLRAKQDPSVLDSMLSSDLEVEKQIAEKLLTRNSELFGAGSLEEYQAKKQLEQAGKDPRDREIAQLKLNQTRIEQQQADRDWKEWKKENAIRTDDEFGKLVDQVRKQNPNLPNGDIVAIARGRAGIKPIGPSHLEAAQILPSGSRGAPPEGNQPNSVAMDALRIGGGEVQAAEAYFEAVGGQRR